MSAPQAYSVDQGQAAYPPNAPAAGYPPTNAAAYPPSAGYPPQDQQYKDKTAFDQQGGGYPPQQPPVNPQQTGGYPQQPAGYSQAAPPPGYYDQQQATATTVVVAQQPAIVTHVDPGLKPNNYLVLSIVNLLFCFFILGLIALVFSLQVDSSWSAGRYEDARRNSNTAKILNYIGIGVGIASWVVVGIIVVVRVVLSVAFAAA